jgi:serine/threonine-protein kinase 24/25/MST4
VSLGFRDFATAHWLPPEVIGAPGYCDRWGDVLPLGITALELLVGRPPLADLPSLFAMMGIATDSAAEPPEQSSDLIREFVRRMLVKDPAGRETATQLMQHPFIASAGDPKPAIAALAPAFQSAKANAREEE